MQQTDKATQLGSEYRNPIIEEAHMWPPEHIETGRRGIMFIHLVDYLFSWTNHVYALCFFQSNMGGNLVSHTRILPFNPAALKNPHTFILLWGQRYEVPDSVYFLNFLHHAKSIVVNKLAMTYLPVVPHKGFYYVGSPKLAFFHGDSLFNWSIYGPRVLLERGERRIRTCPLWNQALLMNWRTWIYMVYRTRLSRHTQSWEKV